MITGRTSPLSGITTLEFAVGVMPCSQLPQSVQSVVPILPVHTLARVSARSLIVFETDAGASYDALTQHFCPMFCAELFQTFIATHPDAVGV